MNLEILDALNSITAETKSLMLTMNKASMGFSLTEDEALEWLKLKSVGQFNNAPIVAQTTQVALNTVQLREKHSEHMAGVLPRLRTLNCPALGIFVGNVTDDVGERYIRAMLRTPNLYRLLDFISYTSDKTDLYRWAKEEVERRAVEDPSFRQKVAFNEHFVHLYYQVLMLGLSRNVTRFFAETAADKNMQLDEFLLAHAFPNYPEVTEAIKNLANSTLHSVLTSPNFVNHYEHLVLKPHMDSIPRVSISLLGQLKDPDLMWKYLYRMTDDSQGVLIALASSYHPDGAFAQVPILERVKLYRRSTQYLKSLFTRALYHGEIQDDVLDGADSKNVTRLLLETAAAMESPQIELLKKTAPVVAAMVLAYRSGR